MKNELRKFARYEIAVSDLPAKYTDDTFYTLNDAGHYIEIEYQITLDDLVAVLDKIEKDSITIGQYIDEWAIGFYEYSIGNYLGLDKAMGIVGEMPMRNNALPENDEDLFRIVYEYMDTPIYMDEDEPAAQVLDIDTIRAIIDAYNSNKGKAVTEWEYPDDLKEAFVYEMEGMINNHLHCSDDYIDLFVRYTEELAAKGNEGAMEVLGYQCYGGTKAFACDWVRARDIFENLFEKTGHPGYANTLGYIYYYGRCNDGVPEDDKAYKYFSYGNAAGLFESTYKLADMIRQGRAVPKNREVAMNMVSRIYSENREIFESGFFDCKFADAALRMGGFCEDRIAGEDGEEGEMADPLAAYAYYQQAQLAINLRMEDEDYYGDDVVAMNVKKALDRVRPNIKFIDKDYIVDDEPRLIRLSIKPDSYLFVKFTKNENGIKVSAEKSNGDSFLVTFPEYDYCALEESIEMYGANVSFIKEPEYDREYCITSIEVLFDEGSAVCFYDTEPVAEMQCSEWMYRLNRPEKEDISEEVRIATVTFENSSKGYDYICESDQVQPGDYAFVEANGEDKVVTVKEIRVVKVSDLPMPIYKYKKLKDIIIG